MESRADTLATATIDGDAEGKWVQASVDPCLLADGTNVLAVEVHQAARTSSDVNFDLALAASRDPQAPRACQPSFRRGDCNEDSTVDISDVVATLGVLFLGEGDPGCDDACDSNDDGTVDISDPITTLQVLFLGQGTIPPPGANDCGVDPTDEALSCGRYGRCS